ncbi:hypothetical protein Harman_38330 [Haloarcula mannanilytica]|uniref:Uncharacterized protein n=1 Tax=Haloarcula mannanilytica TaxID=2509225 RepID=A0A4C2EMT4_9EURY|nr:hypothetical protein Harman_38330 [Haloarcula mannanilytica]
MDRFGDAGVFLENMSYPLVSLNERVMTILNPVAPEIVVCVDMRLGEYLEFHRKPGVSQQGHR